MSDLLRFIETHMIQTIPSEGVALNGTDHHDDLRGP